MNSCAEKIVGTILVIFFVLTVSFQTLIVRNVLNPVSALDLREDIQVYESSECYPSQYDITLNISNSNAKIMINGYYINKSIQKNGDVSFSIYAGDVVECDLRECEDDVEIKLMQKDDDLAVPEDNLYAQSSNNILYLFKAVAKD